MLHSVEIRMARSTDSLENLTDLINKAYRIGEKGIMVDTEEQPFLRASQPDVMDWIQDEKLLIAVTTSRINDNDNNDNNNNNDSDILGCVKVETLDRANPNTGEWGCLAVDLSHQRTGLGRKLVHAAERHLNDQCHCTTVRLDLLSPTHWKHNHKEMLRKWYTERLGYQLLKRNEQGLADYEASTNRFKAGSVLVGTIQLATDADFTTYCKSL